jgi:methylaspartate ammonia-lyase
VAIYIKFASPKSTYGLVALLQTTLVQLFKPNMQSFISMAVMVLLCSGIACTTACTEAIVNDQCSKTVVSARTFSFATELSPQVTAGEQLLLLRC